MSKTIKMVAAACLLSVSGASYACYDHMTVSYTHLTLPTTPYV